ncbi:MAG: M14 family zinc carboxypeptidase [Bacteroidales bacterium]
MLQVKIILIIILTGFVAVTDAQDKPYDEQLAEQVRKYGQAEVSFSYPGYESLSAISRLVPVSAVKEGRVYCVLSAQDIEVFQSLQLQYKVIPREDSKSVESASSVEEAMNWDLYPSYGQYDSIMHKLAYEYPFICRVDTIGHSVEGRLILALKISDNVHEDEDEPEVFYSSNIHGDELQGMVLMLQLAEHLLVNADKGGLEQALVDSLEIWINPLANPDGTYHGGDTITYPTRANVNGTDLNRNFPDPLNPSITPDVENVEMINFMRSRNFVLSANFHSGFEVVNFPWDRWLSKVPADSLWFYNISRRYADTVHNHSAETYMDSYNDGVVRGAVWYRIEGGRQDFVTYELQGREVTIELDNTKQTPAAQLPLLWEYNYRSFLGYLENAFYGIHGRVVDNITGEPLMAKIFIEGHDKDSSHIYSDPETGSFTRMLSPGTWNLTITAGDYAPEHVSDITLEEDIQRYITVRLGGTSLTDSMTGGDDIRVWPVPAGDKLYISAPLLAQGRVDISIYNKQGLEMLRFIKIYRGEESMELDIGGLSPGYYIISLKDASGSRYHRNFISY